MQIIFEPILSAQDVTQIPKIDSTTLKKGDIILVRSDYKYEKYGDHFSLIVGGLIQKERGLRPNLITFPPSETNSKLLDNYQKDDGAVVLLLNADAAQKVMSAYKLHLSEGEISSL